VLPAKAILTAGNALAFAARVDGDPAQAAYRLALLDESRQIGRRLEGRRAGIARFGDALVRGIGLGEGVRPVDHEPGVEGAVLTLGPREVGFGQRARARVAGAQEARHLVSVEAGEIGHELRAPLSAAQNRGHHEVVATPLGGIGQGFVRGQGRRDGVLAQDVGQLDGLSRRRYVLRVERGENGVLVQDVVELAFQARQLLLGQKWTQVDVTELHDPEAVEILGKIGNGNIHFAQVDRLPLHQDAERHPAILGAHDVE